jgi:hypothetical protein
MWTEFEAVNHSFNGYEKDVEFDGKDRKILTVYKSDVGGNHYGPVHTPVVKFTFYEGRLVGSVLVN